MATGMSATFGAAEARFWPHIQISRHVRFGSKADMCSAKRHVRLRPIADMCGAKSDVRLVPIADIRQTYSITSSARPISVLGMLRPSALAVLRLRIISTSSPAGPAVGNLLALEDATGVEADWRYPSPRLVR